MTKNTKLIFGLSSVAVFALAALQGCGSDSDSGPGAGAGAAGQAGAAGSPAGDGGAAGSDTSNSGDAGSGGTVGEGEGGAGGAPAELTQAELCDKFCADEATICTGDLEQYADTVTCLEACSAFKRGELGDTSGDTLDCRIYHLNAAATVNAMVHCPHTRANPTAFCIGPK